MQYCAVCKKRTICQQICPKVERLLRKETSPQRELVVSPEQLENLIMKNYQNIIGNPGEDEALIQEDARFELKETLIAQIFRKS